MPKTQSKRTSTLTEAKRAFYAADYDESLRLLGATPNTADSDFLRARNFLRRGQFVDVIRLLARPVRGRSGRDQAENDLLLGAAYGCTKEFDQGLCLVEHALQPDVPVDLQDDAMYYVAVINWMRFDNVQAEVWARKLLDSSDGNNRARAYILLSWIAVRRHQVMESANVLQRAMREVESAESPDIGVLANALFALAVLCREVYLPEVAQQVRQTAASLPWTRDLATQQFHVSRALGWIDALNGDFLGAFRQLRAASQAAPSDPWRIVSVLDRAYLAQSTGETSFALDQLHDAEEMAKSIQWAQTQGEERTALVMLAEISAPFDPTAATTYLSLFRSIETPITPNLSYDSDPRSTAFKSYSTGLTYVHLGDVEQGRTLLLDAWNIFSTFRYDWRAALAAFYLHAVTGDEMWRHNALQKIACYPKSWIALMIEIKSPKGSVSAENLTPAQVQIFNLLAKGQSTNEIAKQLNRSPNTVRNHLRDIYQTLDVRGRAALLAKMR